MTTVKKVTTSSPKEFVWTRWLFVLVRSTAYAGMLLYWVKTWPSHPWWSWGVAGVATLWGGWELWKRPGDPLHLLRWGAWLEAGLVWVWAVVTPSVVPLFLWISPLSRTWIHATRRDGFGLTGTLVAATLIGGQILPGPSWLTWLQAGVLTASAAYASALGALLREKERLKRETLVSAYEREEHARVEERMNMASRLHDTMGQHWTAVIRALDAADATHEPLRREFMHRAREAAITGLEEMREVVQRGYTDRRTHQDWLDYGLASVRRLCARCGVGLDVNLQPPDWHRFLEGVNVGEVLGRALIEASTNILRHTFAKHIAVQLQTSTSEVLLAVTGLALRCEKGVVPTIKGAAEKLDMSSSGMGMVELQKRVESLGGTLCLTVPIADKNIFSVLRLTLPFPSLPERENCFVEAHPAGE